MIFLTLGTQLPFDRLVKAVDSIATELDEDVFGQIGNGCYKPRSFSFTSFLTPSEFEVRIDSARVIVGHAGIGTILATSKSEKPLIVMARRSKYGEHRNDHQLATLQQMSRFGGVHVAENAEDFRDLLSIKNLKPLTSQDSPQSARLISALRNEIFG